MLTEADGPSSTPRRDLAQVPPRSAPRSWPNRHGNETRFWQSVNALLGIPEAAAYARPRWRGCCAGGTRAVEPHGSTHQLSLEVGHGHEHTVASRDLAVHEVQLTPNTVETFTFEAATATVEVSPRRRGHHLHDLRRVDPRRAGAALVRSACGDDVADGEEHRPRPTVIKLVSEGAPLVSVTRVDLT